MMMVMMIRIRIRAEQPSGRKKQDYLGVFFFSQQMIFMIFQDADFTGKPSVLLVGQYSTGKTTLIRFFLMMIVMIMMMMLEMMMMMMLMSDEWQNYFHQVLS